MGFDFFPKATTTGYVDDADAMLYLGLLAQGGATLSNAVKDAVNTFVKDLKTDSLWAKMKAIYPMIGGTAAHHKWNLKDLRDLDAAFRLTFTGSWTHSATGAKPDGSTAWASTKLVPSAALSQNDLHLSYYSGTNNTASGGSPIGVSNGTTNHTYIYAATTAQSGNIILNAAASNIAFFSGLTDTLKFFLAARTASNLQKGYLNGALNCSSAEPSVAQLSGEITLGMRFRTDSGSFDTPSTLECRFASIGNGLSDAEALSFYNRVQALQTALSRNV